jgi:hypothetical protein
MGEVNDTFLLEGRTSILSLGVSQASPARSSDVSRVRLKTLGWLEASGL